MHWTAGFVGIPYADRGRMRTGADCWGLARLVYAEHLGITIPSYDETYSSCDEVAEVSAIVAREKGSPLWRPVERPIECDVLMFRTGRHDSHAGLFVSPGMMLHMVEEDCSKLQRFDQGTWAKRLTGAYRWHAR